MNYFNILIFGFCIFTVNCEFYSSIDKLKILFDVESNILRDFNNIVTLTNDVKLVLDRKLSPWVDENENARNDSEKYVTNPLNAFLLLKRNLYDVDFLIKHLSKFMEELQEKIKSLKEKQLVEEYEISGAVAGFIRAQRAYQLKSEDVVDGIIDGVKTRKPLSPHDIYVLGASASKNTENDFFFKSYLQIAQQRIDNGGDYLNEVNKTEMAIFIAIVPEEVNDPFSEIYTLKSKREWRTDVALVQKTCRGNLTRSPKETKNLKCRFVFNSPFSSIAPFKVEEASKNPLILMYHEVLSEQEIERLIELARQKQTKARVGIEKNATANDQNRLAQVSWLFDNIFPEETKRFNARFEDMTGLSMETSDALQVQNYGIGGHFYAHYDHRDGVKGFEIGGVYRMATLMLYVTFSVKAVKQFYKICEF